MRALQGLRGFWISQLRKLNWMLVLSKLQWSVQGNVDFSGMFRGLDSVSSMDRSVQSLSSPYTIDVELTLSLPPIPLKKRPSEPLFLASARLRAPLTTKECGTRPGSTTKEPV